MLVDYAIPAVYLEPDFGEAINGDLREIVEGLLVKKPAQRMTAKEAFQGIVKLS